MGISSTDPIEEYVWRMGPILKKGTALLPDDSFVGARLEDCPIVEGGSFPVFEATRWRNRQMLTQLVAPVSPECASCDKRCCTRLDKTDVARWREDDGEGKGRVVEVSSWAA